MNNERQEEHERRVVERHIDYLKHLSQLSTASAIVLLALYQGLDLTLTSIFFPLFFFGLCVLLSVIGLNVNVDPTSTQADLLHPADTILRWAALATFFGGLGTVMLSALQTALPP
jgi:hypothetical protein